MFLIEYLVRISFRVYLVLLLMGLLPTIYTTVRIFLIGQLPDGYGFPITVVEFSV
jgi:hypothetical protein